MALTFDEAEALIVEFCKTYPQALTITYNLAQTQEEIYGPQNTVELRGRISGSYRAASGGADFALANSDSNDQFERTLRHEILGHFGINTFNPSEKRAVLNAIIEARSEVGLERLWAYVDRLYPDLSDMRKAEEVYAFACEAIDPSDRSAAIKGQQSYEDVCVSRTRAMRISDLINLTTMVAEGLHDRTRSQQTFPSDDSAQFKQDSPMKTSEFPVWLAVPPDDREKMRAAAGTLETGRAAVAWDKEEKLWYARPGCDLNRIQEWLPDRSVRAGGGDPESEFLDVLTQAGLIIKGMPVMNGSRQRVATTEDKHGKKSGVYTGYLNRRPAGWYVNYHRAESAKDVTNWTATGGEADPMARLHIRAAAKQSQEDTARERAELHAQQTLAAKQLYDRLPAADPSHPYLVRKGIPPTSDLRQTRNGALVVPFFNVSGTFKTLQYIPEAGEKLLFKDAPKQGHFNIVGGELQAGRPVLYAEGYATARSLNLATGHPVVMTIDAGNMVAVAQILHQQFPTSQHLFMADFDHAKAENKGLLMATEAASKVGGQVLYPAFNESEIAQGFTDFNDLHNSRGLDAVRDQTASILMQPIEVPKMQEPPVSEMPNASNPIDEAQFLPPQELLTQQIQILEGQEAEILSNLKAHYDNYDAEAATIYQAESGLDDLRETLEGLREQLNAPSPEPELEFGVQAAPAALDSLASDNAQPPLDEHVVLTPEMAPVDSAAVQAQINSAPDEAVQLVEIESVIQQQGAAPQAAIEQSVNEAMAAARSDEQSADHAPTQATSTTAPAGVSDERQQWARSQPWFDGVGQDEGGAFVAGRELHGKRVQWLFRTDAELMAWAEKQRQAPVVPAARASAQATSTPVSAEALSDGIKVGPRRGVDEPKPDVSHIDKDLLLTRLTNELQGDKSMLYKLDNEPAFVDRGARLEMVPGAGQSDEKIMAALLTAAQFYRGEIELTGSAAFKAKAIELIVQHRVNVKMKTPEQRAMLDEMRKAYSAPEVNSDAIKGDAPPLYDPAPPVAPIAAAPVQPDPIVMQPAQVRAAPAQNVAAQKDEVVPPEMPGHLQAPDPVDDRYAHYEPAQASDVVASAVVVESSPQAEAASQDVKPAARIDPSVHQSPKAAEHGITGKVIKHGEAPFRFDPKNQNSVYITMRTRAGTQTFWGKELAGLLRETRIEPGRMATLKWLGQQPVVVQAPVRNPETGVVVRYEEKSTHRNQWSLALTDGTTVRTGDDQGVKMVAYDAARFALVQERIAADLPVQIQEAQWPRDGLYWMTPNGQGSAIAGDALSAPRPPVDSQAAGTPIISSWSPDGQLDMALYRGDGPYLQGVVRHAGEYQHVLVSLPDRPDAPPMVINAITEKGLVPIGVGNGINRSGGESVARDHIAFRLEGDTAVRVAKLDFPAEVPPQLHHRLGFDERWKDTQNLPKSAPAPAPQAQPSAVRPS